MPKDLKAAKALLAETKPDLKIGDHVEVQHTRGLWTGGVRSIKPSLQSGWWLEVRQDGSRLTYTVPAERARKIDG